MGPGFDEDARQIRLPRPKPNSTIDMTAADREGFGRAFPATAARNRSAHFGRRWDNATETP
jgi:hypothetical protein